MVDKPHIAPPDVQGTVMEKFFDNKNQVFGTPETLARFATIKDRLAFIAQKDLVLISPEDIYPPGQERSTDAAISRLNDIFNEAGLPPGSVVPAALQLLAKSADLNSPLMRPIDLDGDDRIDVAVILAPKKESSPTTGLAPALAGMPADAKLHSMPGSASDFDKLAMFHEAGHVKQAHGKMLNSKDLIQTAHVRGLESDADKTALREGLRAGISMDVVKTFIRMREASTINQFSLFTAAVNPQITFNLDDGAGNHTTHVYISGAGFKSSPEKMEERLGAMKNVNAVLNMTSARFSYLLASALYMQDELGEGRRPGLPSKEEFEGLRPGNSMQFVSLGMEFAQSNPAFTYLMLDRLKSDDVFKPGSEESRYVKDVLNFYKKHVDLSDLRSPHMQVAKEFLATETLPSLGEMQDAAQEMKHGTTLQGLFKLSPLKSP